MQNNLFVHYQQQKTIYPVLPPPEAFEYLVAKLQESEERIREHQPERKSGGWPKALDLGYMAVHYAGGIAWSRHSLTGGMSVIPNYFLAQTYKNGACSPFWRQMGYGHGILKSKRIPVSRVISFVSPTTPDDIDLPRHPGNEGASQERVVTSARLSGFDRNTQVLIRDLFNETGNPEYIEQ